MPKEGSTFAFTQANFFAAMDAVIDDISIRKLHKKAVVSMSLGKSVHLFTYCVVPRAQYFRFAVRTVWPAFMRKERD